MVEREVERGGIGQRDLLGHRERGYARADRVLGEPSERALGHRHDALARARFRTRATRIDDAHHLHARGVGQLGPHHHVHAADAVEIVQVERDRLHAHA
jgi:hypothetical protein